MFREQACGCIWSVVQGRVRMCDKHRPAKATGDGALAAFFATKMGKSKRYPANGVHVRGWTGR